VPSAVARTRLCEDRVTPSPLSLDAFRRRCPGGFSHFQLKRPISEALICNARYFEYIRHWAKLPAINQRPG
jgi:hypothetical protein